MSIWTAAILLNVASVNRVGNWNEPSRGWAASTVGSNLNSSEPFRHPEHQIHPEKERARPTVTPELGQTVRWVAAVKVPWWIWCFYHPERCEAAVLGRQTRVNTGLHYPSGCSQAKHLFLSSTLSLITSSRESEKQSQSIIIHDSTVLMQRKIISATDATQHPGFMAPTIMKSQNKALKQGKWETSWLNA